MSPGLRAMTLVCRLLPPVTGAISLFIPGRDSRVAWQNAKNNVEIMRLVTEVSDLLPPPGRHVPLGDLVQRCYGLGPFPSLWAVEGLGLWYADSIHQRGQAPRDLLSGPEGHALPPASLTMMHAGIGMSFARRSLENLRRNRSAAA